MSSEEEFVDLALASAIVDEDVPVDRLRTAASAIHGADAWRAVHRRMREDVDDDVAARYTFPFGGVFHALDKGYVCAATRPDLGRCVRAAEDLPRHSVIGTFPGYAYTRAAHRAHLRRLRIDKYDRWLRLMYTVALTTLARVEDEPVDEIVYDALEDHETVRVDGSNSRVPTFSLPFEYLLYLNYTPEGPQNVQFVPAPGLTRLYAVTTRDVRKDEELTAYGHAFYVPKCGDHLPASAHETAIASPDPRYAEAARRYDCLFA